LFARVKIISIFTNANYYPIFVNDPGNEKIVIPECVEIFIRNGIVYVVYEDGVEVGIELIKDLHTACLRITDGKKMPFLFTTKGSFWISNDAREYARKIELDQPFAAVANWAPSLGVRLLAEFYGKFFKPEHPYRVFGTEEEAHEWLMTFDR